MTSINLTNNLLIRTTKHLLLCNLIFCFFLSCGSDDDTETTEVTNPPDPTTQTQIITLLSDDYKNEFIGGGVSIGLFLGHHYSMNSAAQDQAIQLLVKDCNMKYLQDYIQIYPEDDPPYFDRRADYVKAAKVYNPDIEFSLVGNKFPDDLMKEIIVNGEALQVLDTEDPEIYDRLALWFFKLFKGFSDRGVYTEIFNVVNEPDLNTQFRKYHYGLNGDTKEAVARIFKYAVPKFKEMLNDPMINTTNMPIPLIMGPSTISPNGCIDYINFFKSEHPDVWNQIDIVATHQYINGANAQLFQNIIVQSEGKPIYQSETHALKGDGIDFVTVDRPLKAALSLSNLFSTAVKNGVSSWFYFENNYPNEFHPGGLLFIPWAAQQPEPYKHYYAFKQLTSSQPESSQVIGYETTSNPLSDIIAFGKKDLDTIYMHYSNYSARPVDISILASDKSKEIAKINGYVKILTDEENNAAIQNNESFETAKDSIRISIPPFSVNTIKVSIEN